MLFSAIYTACVPGADQGGGHGGASGPGTEDGEPGAAETLCLGHLQGEKSPCVQQDHHTQYSSNLVYTTFIYVHEQLSRARSDKIQTLPNTYETL